MRTVDEVAAQAKADSWVRYPGKDQFTERYLFQVDALNRAQLEMEAEVRADLAASISRARRSVTYVGVAVWALCMVAWAAWKVAS